MVSHRWLSYPLGLDDPRPPAIPAPDLSELYTLDADGVNVQTLTVASHTGTHLDAPRHVIEHGVCITEYEPGELIFSQPVVIDLPLQEAEVLMPDQLEPFADRIRAADMALFRFGWGPIRNSNPERFATLSPGFGVEAAQWLRVTCPGLKAIGMDVPSLAVIACLEETMAAHNVLLEGEGRRFVVVEDMNLNQDLDGLIEVRVNPWLVNGMDSGPCSIVGVIERSAL